MDRRRFLRSSLYFTVISASASLAACGGSDGAPEAPADSFAFPLGLASGDLKDSSVVFWTRCLSNKGVENVPLRLEVSTTSSFETLAATVSLTATRQYDYTVRAKVTGLTAYHQVFLPLRRSTRTRRRSVKPRPRSPPLPPRPRCASRG
ncbi:PhoD-like phosphatase N-terminal domain-containing protein [Massilia sp. B-10]|nr:PhoD-like phosphatase N-terminal domain-containing protein [Massilia sp. B-10]